MSVCIHLIHMRALTAWIICFSLTSVSLKQWVSAMHSFISSFSIFIMSFTPSAPLKLSPHVTGLPIETEVAPMAMHFRTSVPRFSPESTMISAEGYLFFTAWAMLGRTLIVDGAVSGFRWQPLDTQIASTPFSIAASASSLHMIPFTTIFVPGLARLLILLRSLNLNGLPLRADGDKRP